ncbi:MAG: ABC transporter ATP-binding protein, partial [Clostridiales bacterium]|nr:ABC transporter ATP-binding protein [Clostridiales bacterium]
SKWYKGRPALDGLRFGVPKGQVCGLLGPDGAGKTTALDVLSGCLPPDDGAALLGGVDIAKQPGEAKARTGYMPAVPPLYEDLSIRGYLKFVGSARGMSSKEMAEKIDRAIKRVKLADVADLPMKSLSAGARRMASLAQATLCDPDVLLLDEPTADLDPREVVELRAVLAALRGGPSILIATSSITEAVQLCDRVLVLREGRIVADCAPGELAGPVSETGRLLVTVKGSEANVRAVLSTIKGLAVDEAAPASAAGAVDLALSMAGIDDAREALFFALAAAKLPILALRPERATLDELLLALSSERVVAEPAREEGDAHGGDL